VGVTPYLAVRDPVRLVSDRDGLGWLPVGTVLNGRVAALFGSLPGPLAPLVRLNEPFSIGRHEHLGFVLEGADAGTGWFNRAKVRLNVFHFHPTAVDVRQGSIGEQMEGFTICERCAFDVADVFEEAQTALGTRLIGPDEFRELVQYARGRDEMIHTVETYELVEGFEYPRTDLSLYGPDESAVDKPQSERISLAAAEVVQMLTEAETENSAFGFQIWI